MAGFPGDGFVAIVVRQILRPGVVMEFNPEFSSKDSVRSGQAIVNESELRRLIPADRRNHGFLLGFYPEEEARQLLQGKALEQGKLDEIMKRWGIARALIETLPPLSHGPEVLPILEPEALIEISKVMGRADCKQMFPDGTWSVSLLQLSGIIPFQPSIDLAYASNLGEEVLNPTDILFAVKLCFPYGKASTLAVSVDHPQKAITVSGINPSLQVAGFQWGQQDAQGPLVISLYISAGPNLVQATRYRGRYFLTNGYHRTYRLMRAGFTHIPCLVRNANNIAETGALGAGFFSESLLMSPRPPLFMDFADEVLAISVPMPAAKKVVRIRPDEYLVLG
jgi:hypothetical protein